MAAAPNRATPTADIGLRFAFACDFNQSSKLGRLSPVVDCHLAMEAMDSAVAQFAPARSVCPMMPNPWDGGEREGAAAARAHSGLDECRLRLATLDGAGEKTGCFSGAGSDHLMGGTGDGVLDGGPGREDELAGGPGGDKLFGGDGDFDNLTAAPKPTPSTAPASKMSCSTTSETPR